MVGGWQMMRKICWFSSSVIVGSMVVAVLQAPLCGASSSPATYYACSKAGMITKVSTVPHSCPKRFVKSSGLFAHANAKNANFTGAQLSNANLTIDVLTGAISGGITGNSTLPSGWSLISGYLIGPGANLTSANPTHLDFTSQNLNGANFSSACVTYANFTGPNLTSADPTNSILNNDIFTNATCPNGKVHGAGGNL